MLILLPPSEGKAPGGNGPGWTTAHPVDPISTTRARITDELTHSDPQPLGLAGTRALEAQRQNRQLSGSPTLPAHQRYTGVVMTALDADTLTRNSTDRAASSIVFASGLGGVLTWNEPTPAYRLKMSARLGTLGRIDKTWQPALTTWLNSLPPDETIIDLLPHEHRAAFIAPSHITWIRLELIGPNGEKAGHNGKAAKGQLARALLETHDPIDIAHARTWTSPQGYRIA